MKSIPTDEAVRLCEEVQKEKGVRIFSQCWGCLKFTKDEPLKRCFIKVDRVKEDIGLNGS